MGDYEARRKRGWELAKKMGREDHMLLQKEVYPPIYEFSIGHLYGDVWTRPHLNIRERELITLAANIAMGRQIGIKGHYRSAQHIGITKEEIMELIIHVGHYSGWPTIAHAVSQYAEVQKEQAGEKKKKKTKKAEGRKK